MNTVIVCPNPDDSGNNGNSSNNVANLATPIGSVLFSGSSRNCEGFLDCDGEVYSKNAFPDLYLTLINAYDDSGSNKNKRCLIYDGSNDFIVPPFKQTIGQTVSRFANAGQIYYYNSSNNYVLNDLSGGNSNVVLDLSNVPMHEHQYQRYGGTQTTGLANGSFDPQSGTILNKTECELYDCSGNLAQSGAAQPFSIVPNYLRFNSVIRACEPDDNSLAGYTTITTENNKFYVSLLWNDSNFPTPSTDDFKVFECTLSVGNFKRLQLLQNLLNAIVNAVNSQTSVAQLTVNSASFYSYRIAPDGQYTMSLNIDYTGSNVTPGTGYVQFLFNTVANMPYIYYYPFGTTNIPQEVLDKTANTLGFFTRSCNPGGANNYVSAYSVASNYGYDLIEPPKAMSINFEGSIQNGDFTLADFDFLSFN